MKFITNTKPLVDALNLGVVNSNVSPFHKKSTIIEVTASKHILTLNIEAESIKTQIALKGSGDDDSTAKIFVGSLLIKQLVSTFDSDTVELEFAEGGLVLHSGSSKFTLPKLIDEDDIELDRPAIPDITAVWTDIDKDSWKFIRDNQMYAVSMSFIYPIYRYVWVGGNDVLVGDFDNSLFTHSTKGTLGSTCLVSETIVNLLESLPESAKLTKLDSSYLVKFNADAIEYISEFIPKYENTEDVADYNAQIFLERMNHQNISGMKISPGAISKFLSQADLLSSSSEDTITFSLNDDNITLKDNNVDCKLEYEGKCSPFSVEFKTESIRKVINNYNSDKINFIPVIDEDDSAVGLLLWDNDLTTIVAGVD